jgi:PAS domain S-box-containing protein
MLEWSGIRLTTQTSIRTESGPALMNYRDLFRQTPALLQIVAADGRLMDVSDLWLKTLGYERKAILRRPFANLLVPTLPHGRAGQATSWLAESQGRTVAWQLLHHNGTVLEMAATIVAQPDRNNQPYFLVMLVALSEHKRTEQALQTISQTITRLTGGEFFRSLVSQLTQTFAVRYALATQCTDPSHTRLRTLAYVDRTDFFDNFEYNVAGTPCAGVIAGEVCYYPSGLNVRFRMDLNEESYLGVPMRDSQGNIVGHLALFDDKPMQHTDHELALMQLLAARAGWEVERQQVTAQLAQTRSELDQLYDQIKALRQQTPEPGLPAETSWRALMLHRSTMQLLYSLTLLAEGWRRMAKTGNLPQADEALAELGQLGQQALQELRLLLNELPAPTHPLAEETDKP